MAIASSTTLCGRHPLIEIGEHQQRHALHRVLEALQQSGLQPGRNRALPQVVYSQQRHSLAAKSLLQGRGAAIVLQQPAFDADGFEPIRSKLEQVVVSAHRHEADLST